MSANIFTHPLNYYHNQDNEHIYDPTNILVTLCYDFVIPPVLIHPQETLLCFLSHYFAFLEFSMNVITQYIAFVWLLSLSILI